MQRGLWVVATLVACVACSPPQKAKTQLGAILSVTRDLANIGQVQLDSVQLAVGEINAAGGVNGLELEVVNKDDASDSPQAVTAAEALVALKVPVAIGAAGSGKTLAAAPRFIEAKIPLVSASSTSPAISTLQDDGYVLRTCPSDALQGRLLAKRARAKPFSRIAVIHLPDAYGTGLADAFAAAFTQAGGTVTFKQAYVEGQMSYTTLLDQAYAGNPEAILLVAYAIDGAQLMNDYWNSVHRAKNTFFYFTDGTQDPAFVTAVGSSKWPSIQHEGTGPAAPAGATNDRFLAAYKTKFSRDLPPGGFAQNAYDATYLVALAMAAQGENTAAAVHGHITAVSAGGMKFGPENFAQARDAAKAKTDIDFEGVSGNVDLDDKGDVIAPYDVWRIVNNTFETIERSVSP